MDEELLNNIHQLLEPQPCLNLRLFDTQGQIIEDIRQRIIWRVKVMFERAFGQFAGLSLEDAYLCGSSANYLWREESDFDIWLKINIDTEQFFIHDRRKANRFLSRVLSAHHKSYKNLYGTDHCLIDAKLVQKPLKKIQGAYSLFNNRWEVVPRQNMTAEINPQRLYDATSAKISATQSLMDNLRRDKTGRISLADVKRLMRQYNQIIDLQFQNPTNYIIYKLMRRNKITVELHRFMQDELAKTLSMDSPLA